MNRWLNLAGILACLALCGFSSGGGNCSGAGAGTAALCAPTPYVVATGGAVDSAGAETSQALPAPGGIPNGQAIVLFASIVNTSSTTWTPPAGFSQIGSTNTASAGFAPGAQAVFCKTSSNETQVNNSYTISWTTSSFFNGGVVVVAGTDCSKLETSASTTSGGSSVSTINSGSITSSTAFDYELIYASQNDGHTWNAPTPTTPVITTFWNVAVKSNILIGFPTAQGASQVMTFADTASGYMTFAIAFHP